MSHVIDNRTTFGELFKLFRLRAGIETLTSFANLMAEHGMVYENSLYSRWQRNERIPRDRKVVLLMIEIFAEHGGIVSAEEANILLESTDQRELTHDELTSLSFQQPTTERAYEKIATPATSPQISISTYIKSTLFLSKMTFYILAAFLLQSFLFFWIWKENIFGTIEAYTAGYVYGYIAIIGIVYGLRNLQKNTHTSTARYPVIKWLCIGLLCQFIGLQIWFYNNLKGIEVPYPSLAEFGYFGLIPCYIYAALAVAAPHVADKIAHFFHKNGLLVLAPILMVIATTTFYFADGRNVNFQSHLADILDLAYPIGETIPMTILIYALVFKMHGRSNIEKFNAIVILGGFFLQFVAEYTFIFSARLNLYVNTGLIDYIYCLSYTYMALTIVMLTNMNRLYMPNVNTATTHNTKPTHANRLYSALNPFQN